MFRTITFAVIALCAFAGCGLNPIAPIIQLGLRWHDGEAQKYYATEQTKIYEATKATLAEFKFPILEEKIKDNIIYLKAGDDDRFRIKITEVRENVTKLSIRINVMGDKAYAEMIYRHVDKYPDVEQFASVTSLNDAMERQRFGRHRR